MTYRELTEYLTSKFGNSLIAGYSKKSADLEVEKDTLDQLKSIGAITDEEIKSLNKPAHTNCEKTQCFNQVSEQSAKQSQESFDLSNFFESIFGVKIPTTNQTQKEEKTLTVDPLSLLGNLFGKDFEKVVQQTTKVVEDILQDSNKHKQEVETSFEKESNNKQSQQQKTAKIFYEKLKEFFLEKLEEVQDWTSRNYTLIHTSGLKMKTTKDNNGVFISWGDEENSESIYVDRETIGVDDFDDLIFAYYEVVDYLRELRRKKKTQERENHEAEEKAERLVESFFNSLNK